MSMLKRDSRTEDLEYVPQEEQNHVHRYYVTIHKEVLSEAPVNEGVPVADHHACYIPARMSALPRRPLPLDTHSSAPSDMVTSYQAPPTQSTNARFGLRRDRAPRYRCGTCGLTNCVNNYMVHAGLPIRPRGVLLTSEKELPPTISMVNRLVI